MNRKQNAQAARHILLGVTGGIAAYKACELTRLLRKRGCQVQVVMTEAASEFVSPLTFQALSHRPVRTQLFDTDAEAGMGHIELARWAEQVLVAPASADFMAKLAQGRADDLLSTLCLATEAPLTLAPAMNWAMWRHPATRSNAALLQERGVTVLGPALGALAEDEVGEGRMWEPEQLATSLLAPLEGSLSGRRVLVDAGPTREALDPVRYISNRSSGRMGFAVAEAAARAGAEVILVAGPVSLPTPPGVSRVDVESAAEMLDAVMAHADSADIFIGVAAVGDYRLAPPAEHKIKKSGEVLTLSLNANPDIVAHVAAMENGPFTVGFAAETRNVETNARKKLKSKHLDMIAANKVGNDRGFDRPDNALTVIWHNGKRELPSAPKTELARQLMELTAERYQLAINAAVHPSAQGT